jgi:hypothetical protein
MEDSRLHNIEQTVTRIERALVGSVDAEGISTIGIIEKQRNQERELIELKEFKAVALPQIKESLDFKRNIMKVVAGMSIIIPLIVEVLKYGGEAIINVVKHMLGK